MRPHGKKITINEVPAHFDEHTIDRIKRIEGNPNVMGFLFIRNGQIEINSVPEIMSQTISHKLPILNNSAKNAVAEIDVLDELVAFRIETRKYELLVAPDKEFCAVVLHEVKKKGKRKVQHKKKDLLYKYQIMKIVHNLLKDKRDEWLVKTTAMINNVNPMIDRIMNDESVGGVIMTNKEGAPILTNTNIMTATNYGASLQRLGVITQTYIKDMDPFDEVLVLRITTKQLEIMVAPHAEFTIIVIQQFRHKSTLKENK